MDILPVVIEPHVGIGPLRFGQSRREVRQLLGEPGARDAEGVPGRETWLYPALYLDVSFDDDADWLCVSFCVEHPRFILSGRQIFGLSFSQLQHLAPELHLGPCTPDITSPFGPSLEFPEKDVYVSFVNSQASTVSWGAEITPDDQFAWPGGSQVTT